MIRRRVHPKEFKIEAVKLFRYWEDCKGDFRRLRSDMSPDRWRKPLTVSKEVLYEIRQIVNARFTE